MIRALLKAAVGAGALYSLMVPSAVAAQTEDIAALLTSHRQLVRSMRLENDTVRLSTVALTGFVVVAPGGVVETRAQVVRGVRNFSADDVRVEVEVGARHDSTIVLVGTVDGNTSVRGPVPQFGKVRFMAVYVRSAGRWQLLAQSNTPCHERAIQVGRC